MVQENLQIIARGVSPLNAVCPTTRSIPTCLASDAKKQLDHPTWHPLKIGLCRESGPFHTLRRHYISEGPDGSLSRPIVGLVGHAHFSSTIDRKSIDNVSFWKTNAVIAFTDQSRSFGLTYSISEGGSRCDRFLD